MSVHLVDPPSHPDRGLKDRSSFSTDLFTGLNIAVFLVLAASVVAAGVIYSQGG